MPKIVDHDLRREEIAEAVWRTVVRAGIDATTVRRVAAEASVSTGVLAHYFRDKEAVLVFALRLASTRAGRRMRRASEGVAPLQALAAVAAEALPLDQSRREEWAIWLAFWGAAVATDVLSHEHNARYADWRATIRDLLRHCRNERTLAYDIDLDEATDSLVALIDGLGIQAMLDPRRVTAQYQRQIIDGFVDRLRR
jgi:AcrR family transcriptional regulator